MILKTINKIEKNIKGNNGNLNSLKIDEKNIAFFLIDKLIQNSEIKEKTKSILQNMKNEKKFKGI